MFKLKHVKPEEATGAIKKAYDVFPPSMGIPEPLQLMSVSPQLLQAAVGGIRYFMSHPRLEFPLMAAIRLMAATEFCYDYCIKLNAGILQQAGLEQKDLEALCGDLEGLPYEENEITLLRLVQKVVKAPETVTQADVQACRDAGWEESDILEASYHAAYMQLPNRLMTAFHK